ncbi:Thiamine kinase [Lachnospiraceae bacterium NE2001]|nr:Thiamine kinase [Lachnospiraceae bacterium NE2001]
MNKELLNVICDVMNVDESEISNIERLTSGMTNKGYVFTYKDERYIIRIPGVGTDKMVNRTQEASVYSTIDGLGFSDDIIYINPENGIKVSKFLEDTHVCDPFNDHDVILSLKTLCRLHSMKLKVDYHWDTYREFDLYDSMWQGQPSIFSDYEEIKNEILGLRGFIEENVEENILTHVDPNHTNNLITNDPKNPKAYLIDWEFASMYDPHIDLVCFAIFAFYDRERMEWYIDKYFEIRNQECSYDTRTKIYAYIATYGLLWTSWAEAKRIEGQDLTDYAKVQYKYAKDYLKIVQDRLGKKEEVA